MKRILLAKQCADDLPYLETEEFQVYRAIDQLPMLYEDAQNRGYVSLSYKKTVI